MHRKPAGQSDTFEGKNTQTERPIPQEIAAIGHPEPPVGSLTEAQLEICDDVVGSLPVKLLTRADHQVLERMAVAWATFRLACELINQSGLLTRSQRTASRCATHCWRCASWRRGMEVCGQALGLSPLARTRLTAPDQEDTEPLTLLLGPPAAGKNPN